MRVINKSNQRIRCGGFIFEVSPRPVFVPEAHREAVQSACERFPQDLEIDADSTELERLRSENERLKKAKKAKAE